MPKHTAKPLNIRQALAALTPRRLEFVNWLVSPSPSKGSDDEWALLRGLNPLTVRMWKREPAFRRAWDALLMQHAITPDRTDRMLQTLYEAAASGDSKAAIEYLRFVRRWTPEPEVELAEPAEFADYSTEELARIVEAERTSGSSQGQHQ